MSHPDAEIGHAANGSISARTQAPACRRRGVLSVCFALVLGILAPGCGDSDDGPVQEGVFLDSAVAGLTYRSATLRGLTDARGAFQYREGEWVVFSVGDLELGRAMGRPVVTPLDLTIDGYHQARHVTANFCVFLQTLDADRKPRNGIEIPEATRRFFTKNDVAAQVPFAADPQTFRANLHLVMEQHHLAVGKSEEVVIVPHETAFPVVPIDYTDPLSRIKAAVQMAMQTYVFAPNDANTWSAIHSMINSFLTDEWKEGQLEGATPAEAFSTSVGLGTTMTADDLLDGVLRARVQVRLSGSTEFIELEFMQVMATSS